MNEISRRAWRGLALFVVALALLLFLPAWSLRYWQAWLYLGVFATSTAAITRYLELCDPALLARRLNIGVAAERQRSQRLIQVFAQIAFLAIFLVPALDHHFRWSRVPPALVLVADAAVALGLFIVFLVFRANTFTSATVEVAPGQTVISTGPYAWVRHPMYSGALLMMLATPVALGSWWGLLAFLPMLLVIVWRLLEEERFLLRELPGYADYCSRVRWRLLPGGF